MQKLIYVIIATLLASVVIAAEKGSIHIYCQPDVKIYMDNENIGKANKKDKGKILNDIEFGTYKFKLTRNNKNEEFTVNLHDSLYNYISTMFNSKKTVDDLYEELYFSQIDSDTSNTTEQYPDENEKIDVDIFPEMIYQEAPVYPKNEKQRGLTGVVWVKALVDRRGNVVKSVVGKSSKIGAFDNAAIKASYNNKFRPAILNGKPVALWVTYKVNFEIGH